MQTQQPARPLRSVVWVGIAVCLCVLFYFLPLFHVVPLEAARSASAATVFDPNAFVEALWTDRMLPSANSAVDAGELLAAFEANPADAAERFGQRLGVSGASSYFVSGSGRIVAVNDDAVAIALKDRASPAVVIGIGPVFGNAVRDGSGLLDVSDFPNSQDFNAISSEINRRVEERIFPALKEKAAVGAAVRFVGGVEIADAETQITPLRLVPVVIEFR